jgi:hypothetical protein
MPLLDSAYIDGFLGLLILALITRRRSSWDVFRHLPEHLFLHFA